MENLGLAVLQRLQQDNGDMWVQVYIAAILAQLSQYTSLLGDIVHTGLFHYTFPVSLFIPFICFFVCLLDVLQVQYFHGFMAKKFDEFESLFCGEILGDNPNPFLGHSLCCLGGIIR